MRTLVLLLPGLGDALCAGPILAAAAQRQDWTIDALTMLDPVAEYAATLTAVRRVFNVRLLRGPEYHRIWRLRRERYDAAILPFPAARWQYAAVAAAVSAKTLYVHDYGGAARALAGAARAQFTALGGGHRLAENVRLARRAGLDPQWPPQYVVPLSWRAAHLPGVVGVHTGSMRYKGNEGRRWPIDAYVHLIGRLLRHGVRVRAFVGPWEVEDARRLRAAHSSGAFEIVQEPLAGAARALAQCEVFVGNDAGFAHLAAALDVKTVVIFGMSNPLRAAPAGRTIVLRPSKCPACHDEGMRRFACVRNIDYRCIRQDVSVDAVLDAVLHAMRTDVEPRAVEESGEFQLYGRRRA